jgi:hypothetical protein
MAIKISKTTLSVNGKRAGIRIDAGPWVAGVPAEMIKIRPRASYFPREFGAALMIENNSDMREDYFEPDCIRLMPGHPLYAEAKALAA